MYSRPVQDFILLCAYFTYAPAHFSIKSETRRAKRQRQRARRVGCAATLTAVEWLCVLAAYDFACVTCGGVFETMEHVVPLSAGGGTTVENCRPMCTRCNQRRGRLSAALNLIKRERNEPMVADLLAFYGVSL